MIAYNNNKTLAVQFVIFPVFENIYTQHTKILKCGGNIFIIQT